MADFYGTAAKYRSYCTARGYDVSADDDDADIEKALLVSSEWLDGIYGPTWGASGTLKTGGRSQVREWPRTGFVDMYSYNIPVDEVPREIENSTYEATRVELATPGSLFKNWTPSKYSQVSIDGAVSVTYADFNSAADAQMEIAAIPGIMYPLVNNQGQAGFSGASGRVHRV